MFNPDTSPQSAFFTRSIEAAAPSLGVKSVVLAVRTTADIEPASENFAREPNGGLVLPTDSFTGLRRQLIADLAARHRLPSISAGRYSVARLIEKYGRKVNMMKWKDQLGGDCPKATVACKSAAT
jgi:hypothetical protein